MLRSGTAEIFGSELVPKKEYVFSDVKLAAFTWYGAQIEASAIDGVSEMSCQREASHKVGPNHKHHFYHRYPAV